MPILLLTRPLEAARQFAAEFNGPVDGPQTPEIIISPALKIVATGAKAPDITPAGLVITSQNALRHANGLLSLPTHVVGRKTAQAAERLGLSIATCTATAQDLVAAIPQDAAQPLLHVRGAHLAQPVAEMLRARGITCAEWIVYDQIAQPLSDAARAALAGQRPVILPLFSPRSARIVRPSLETARAPVICVAISGAVAEALGSAATGPVNIAERPEAQAMRAAVRAALTQGAALEGQAALR